MFGKNVKKALEKTGKKISDALANGPDVMAGYYPTGKNDLWGWECRGCWKTGRPTSKSEAMSKATKHGRSCDVVVRNYQIYGA